MVGIALAFAFALAFARHHLEQHSTAQHFVPARVREPGRLLLPRARGIIQQCCVALVSFLEPINVCVKLCLCCPRLLFYVRVCVHR